jgi:predicted membrane GTPase involved in stress response
LIEWRAIAAGDHGGQHLISGLARQQLALHAQHQYPKRARYLKTEALGGEAGIEIIADKQAVAFVGCQTRSFAGAQARQQTGRQGPLGLAQRNDR